MCDYHYFEIIYMHICTYPINVVDRNISPYQVILARKKFLKFVILFLKYIKYTYFYTNTPILFVRTISN